MAKGSVRLTSALRGEYQALFDSCIVAVGRQAAVEKLVDALAANRGRYERVGDTLNVPWHFVAVVHNMEASQRFDRHLHNGDPLSRRTTHVPVGRPKAGGPPFSWEQSAADALAMKRMDRWSDWSLSGTLYRLEGYNGWGYRRYHPHVKSPYLWAASNHYTSGKYVADGTWSDTAVSKQCGGAVLLRRMAERGIVDIAQHGVAPAVQRALQREQPILRWSKRGRAPYAKELQVFLNTLPGIYVKPDGWPGDKTSDAFRKVSGYYLHGDPRTTDVAGG